MRRLSTLSFARRIAPRLDGGPDILRALDLPMVPPILDTMDREDCALFFIKGPVQVFKTLLGQLRLIRNHRLRPRKAGWYAPTKDFRDIFAASKFSLFFDPATGVPDLLDLQLQRGRPLSPLARNPLGEILARYDPSKNTNTYRKLCDGSHLLLSAETENDRTGHTLQDLYIDEPHRYRYGWIKQIENRRENYPHAWSQVMMSTGLTTGATVGPDAEPPEGAEASEIWDRTTQSTWHSRCPHCHGYFEPRYLHREREDDPESKIIGGLIYERRWLENGAPDDHAINATLRYRCPLCRKAEFPDTDHSRRALNGTAAQPLGRYIDKNARPSPRHFGWDNTALTARPWAPIAYRWEVAQIARQRGDLEPLAKVIREQLGGVWNPIAYHREKKLDLKGGYKMLPVEQAA